jgi:dUTP pyrophosphatase
MTMTYESSIEVELLLEEGATPPSYGTQDAAGADVRACIPSPIILSPGCSVLVPTGLKMSIPRGYEVQVRPRSGLALKNQVTVLNTPGTIDADYRGEVGVILINHGKTDFTIEPGMRIAQLVLAQVVQASFVVRETLTCTARGAGGFGHTGTH